MTKVLKVLSSTSEHSTSAINIRYKVLGVRVKSRVGLGREDGQDYKGPEEWG